MLATDQGERLRERVAKDGVYEEEEGALAHDRKVDARAQPGHGLWEKVLDDLAEDHGYNDGEPELEKDGADVQASGRAAAHEEQEQRRRDEHLPHTGRATASTGPEGKVRPGPRCLSVRIGPARVASLSCACALRTPIELPTMELTIAATSFPSAALVRTEHEETVVGTQAMSMRPKRT